MKPPATVRSPLLHFPAWQRYGVALAVLAMAVLSRKLLGPNAQDTVPLVTTFAGVILTAWFFGSGAATLVAIGGYVAAQFPFHPGGDALTLARGSGVFASLLYAFACGVTIHLCESLRKARSRHAESEQKAALVLENMSECFCALDRNWRLTYVNPRAEKYLTLGPADAQGRSLFDAIPHLVGSVCEQRLQQALQSREPCRFECVEIVPGRVTAMSATPSPEGISLFLHDVTAEKQHLQQLEHEVARRTAELRETISELEAFSYTLVHDMRAPLRSIRAFSAAAATNNHALSPDVAVNLRRIDQTAARMDRLIIDVLNYSRLTRQPFELQAVDLDEVVHDVVISQPAFSPGKADILIEGPLPRVRGNEALLGQCFTNLLQNATKFVPDGVKPRVLINATRNGDRVRVSIHDNGIGIAPDATERIFEPFQREDPRYEGTGIGLAIVRKLVERLAGRVGVESGLGQGSRFWVELPPAGEPYSHPPRPDGVNSAPAPDRRQ